MVVGEIADRAEVVVVGGGPGGYEAALRLAHHGKRVVLVERDAVGGVCLNIGCIPSKALIHQAELAYLPVTEADTGVRLTPTIDGTAMLAHRRNIVNGLTGGVSGLLQRAKVEVWTGAARFARSDRLVIEQGENVKHLEFDHCVLATGSRPIVLPGFEPGHRGGVNVLDSTGALALEEVPERMVVIGGGYIGIELGTAWAKLGASVTIVEMGDRILPGMDPTLGRVVSRRLKDLGVAVLLNTKVSALRDTGVIVEDGSQDRTDLSVDTVIVCVGRRPNTDQLHLEATGITVDDRGLVPVGPNRRAHGSISAIGDITAGPALAHKATAEARVAADAIAGLPAAFDPTCIPEVVFSDPEVASVGLTPSAAKEVDSGATSARVPFTANGRAKTLGDAAGFVQLVIDSERTVVGAQLAGRGVSELVSELALAIEMAATITDVADTIHPHPTMAEAIMEAAHQL